MKKTKKIRVKSGVRAGIVIDITGAGVIIGRGGQEIRKR